MSAACRVPIPVESRHPATTSFDAPANATPVVHLACVGRFLPRTPYLLERCEPCRQVVVEISRVWPTRASPNKLQALEATAHANEASEDL